jgi:hypothetical protein
MPPGMGCDKEVSEIGTSEAKKGNLSILFLPTPTLSDKDASLNL